MSDKGTHWYDRAGVRKGILWTLYIACVVGVILDFVIHRHVYHNFERFPVFYPVFGFIALVAIVMGAKTLRKLVKRPENYYGEAEADDVDR